MLQIFLILIISKEYFRIQIYVFINLISLLLKASLLKFYQNTKRKLFYRHRY